MPQRKHILAILLLGACGESGGDAETFGDTSTDATTSSEVGTGTESDSGETDPPMHDMAVGDDATGDSDETGDGDETGWALDMNTGTESTGDGDGDGDTGAGEPLFPGDACDPFVDVCIDEYGCHVDDSFSDDNPEFRCRAQLTAGNYGEPCLAAQHCNDGLKCEAWTKFPDGVCGTESSKCCMDLCVYEEVCDSGTTCSVTWWPADLEDYLDMYTGIGICAAQ